MMNVGESDREECAHSNWSILYRDFRATWHCEHKWHRSFTPSLGSYAVSGIFICEAFVYSATRKCKSKHGGQHGHISLSEQNA